MASEGTITVEALAQFSYGKGLPERDRNTSGPIPVYGSNGIVGYHDKPLTNGPTIIVGRKGTVGAIHYSAAPCWPIDTTFFYSHTDKDLVRYRYYALKTLGLEHMNADSAVPGLNRDAAHARILRDFAEDEQRAIANILGTFDDKIELNRRMNETLEAVTRVMFKSWFVDFDPVRAKMSGEPPEAICQRLGLTPDLLALYPDRLADSELGEIPEGWEVAPLEKLTSYLTRGVSPKYTEDGGILVLNQKCIRDGYVDTSKGRRHDQMQRKVDGRLLENGDILVNSTGVGTLGRVAQIIAIDEPTIVDSHVTVVRADPEKISWNYLGITLLGRQNEIEALGEGSTGQTELSRTRLGKLSILVPPRLLRKHFDDCVVNLRQRTSSNIIQNVTLAQARDALLPKLLSGELRVPVTGDV